MKNYLLVTMLLTLLYTACKVQKDKEGNAPILLSYSRTPCFGSCEVFDLTIYNDGKVDINKKHFMAEKGQFTLELKKKEVKELIASLDQMNFCNLDSLYGSGVSDLPSSVITYNCGSRYKTVVAIMNYPDALKTFIEEMALLVKRNDLVPVNFE
jgi:hypothetical protein